jgi:arylsulfatase A-like enzyme
MKEGRRRWLALTGATALAGATGGAVGAWVAGSPAGRPGAERRISPMASVRSAGRPAYNVLLIVSSQERADLPAGLPLPGHERLMQAGTRFANWHANSTPATPSRACLYFGRHTQKTGLLARLGAFAGGSLPDDLPSLGHCFRANGYRTAYKGRWQLSGLPVAGGTVHGRYPHTRDALEPFGFSDYNPQGDIPSGTWAGHRHDPQIAAEAAEWLLTTARQSSTPWLLAVNFVNPHDINFLATGRAQAASRPHGDYRAPLAGPPPDPLYQSRWDYPLPANRHDDLTRKPWAQRNQRDWVNAAFGTMPPGGAAWSVYQNHYFNAIRDVDRHLVSVLDALDASGQAERTIVVYTADHGEMAGAHGLRQTGPYVYQENSRVPFIVRHPDVTGGRQTEALGCTIDLIPTLLALAGGDAASIHQAYPWLDGVSVAPAVAEPAHRGERDQRGILFNHCGLHETDTDHSLALLGHGIEADRLMPARALMAGLRPLPRLDLATQMRGIHTGRHKLARWFKPSEHHRPAEWETLVRHNTLELYDLQRDPLEIDNLAHAPEWNKGLVMQLNAQLNALVEREIGSDLGQALPLPRLLTRL